MNRFQGKTYLVTGGNSGIGFETVKTLIQEGAKVFFTGRNQDSLDRAKKEFGPQAVAIRADQSDQKGVEKVLSELKKNGVKLDGAFLNAGIAEFAPISQTTEDLFDRTFSTNVKGTYFMLQGIHQLLNPKSSVVFNASSVVNMGMENSSVYTASKAAVASLAKVVSSEWIKDGIRLNVVNPGPIETPIFERMGLPKEALTQMAAQIQEGVPMKRFGAPRDIAQTVAFLLSDHSGYITGTSINVDGGMSDL